MLSLIAASFAASASGADGASPHPYTLAATRACLVALPDAVVGLPPAAPPVPPALFVYVFSATRLRVEMRGQLGIWYEHSGGRTYQGIVLSFFTSPQEAGHLASMQTWFGLYGGTRIRNVVVGWDDKPARPTARRKVLGCLRSEAGTRARPRAAPPASLATFAGSWGGHTRGLSVDSRGGAVEDVYSGCCHRWYYMRFQILSVSGTLTRASATFRVTAFNPYESKMTGPHVGQIGRLLLRNGIVTNTLTKDYFCSSPAWGATGACGA